MLTLTFGYKKPQTGDRGSVFWPALEDDIQQLNDHTHNGVNSANITSAAVTAVTQTFASGAWTTVGDGTFTLSVTHSAGTTRETHAPLIKADTNAANEGFGTLHPKIVYSSTTVFVLTVNKVPASIKVFFVS